MRTLEQEERKHSLYREQDRFFERLNAKYNRLWEQETQIVVLVTEVIAGFSFAILALNTSSYSSYKSFKWVLMLIIILLSLLTLILGKIDFERFGFLFLFRRHCSVVSKVPVPFTSIEPPSKTIILPS